MCLCKHLVKQICSLGRLVCGSPKKKEKRNQVRLKGWSFLNNKEEIAEESKNKYIGKSNQNQQIWNSGFWFTLAIYESGTPSIDASVTVSLFVQFIIFLKNMKYCVFSRCPWRISTSLILSTQWIINELSFCDIR